MAALVLYSTFVLYRNWGYLGGKEIHVSNIGRSFGFPASGGFFNFNAAVRLFDDKIILKDYPTNILAMLSGNFPSVGLQEIIKVEKKNTLASITLGPLLEIYITGSSRRYRIYADESTLNSLILYFNSHNIQVLLS